MPDFRFKKEVSDADLLVKFKESGETEWLGQLYSRYMHLVFGVCLKYLKERETARDCVIEIFEKLVKELLLKDVKDFKPWLYVVTKNHCLMALRHNKSVQKKEVLFIKEQSLNMENYFDWHPYENNGKEIIEKKLKECIKRLKIKQKQCIELFYLKSHCYNQISDTLNIDVKKVKSFIQNGKRNLKICLENADETNMNS